MCLALIIYNAGQQLYVAHNRDELLERPTECLHYWDNSKVLGPRDLASGGTWLGIHSDTRRMAFVTNVVQYNEPPKDTSRGNLVVDFINSKLSSADFCNTVLRPKRHDYSGYNIVCWDGIHLVLYCNIRDDFAQVLPTGIYVVSNDSSFFLDSSWYRIQRARDQLVHVSQNSTASSMLHSMLEILRDDSLPDAQSVELPNTGYGPDFESKCLSMSIKMFTNPDGKYFGTRSRIAMALCTEDSSCIHEEYLHPDTREWIKQTIHLPSKLPS